MSVTMPAILDTLAEGRDLNQAQAAEAFNMLMQGELSPAQAGALLMGLRAKGETADEVGAAVNAALGKARKLTGLSGTRIDTCGTGGDMSCSFNCSTATALVLAGLGHQVVKHGNRSVSSSCGSADIVEGLGLPMPQDPAEAVAELGRRDFVFLFAPFYHPAFKHIMPVRQELGVRTLFNLMGPLLNPARPTHQLLGVARAEIQELMARVLAMTGVGNAAVVHGFGGFDELTPFGPSAVVWVRDGELSRDEIDPKDLGLGGHKPEDVAVTGKEHALEVLQELISGKGPQAMRDMLVLNLAVCLHLLEDGLELPAAVDKAKEALDRGVAMKVVG